MWSDFKLIQAQAVMFTPQDQAFNSSKILARFLPKIADRFNGELNVLSHVPQLPTGMPIHVPQIMLKSGDGSWQLNMSSTRVDIIWANQDGAQGDWIETVRECAEVLKEYSRLFDAKVNRLALLTNRICPADDAPKKLIDRFCNQQSRDGPFIRSRHFEIHNFKVYTPKRKTNSDLNSWIRCKAVELQGKVKVILVENDLNTLENIEPALFSSEGVEEFFIAAPLELNDIGQLYFD